VPPLRKVAHARAAQRFSMSTGLRRIAALEALIVVSAAESTRASTDVEHLWKTSVNRWTERHASGPAFAEASCPTRPSLRFPPAPRRLVLRRRPGRSRRRREAVRPQRSAAELPGPPRGPRRAGPRQGRRPTSAASRASPRPASTSALDHPSPHVTTYDDRKQPPERRVSDSVRRTSGRAATARAAAGGSRMRRRGHRERG
jgi:hypothetical protein